MLSARALYTLAWYCALPLAPLRLWWRGRREPGYRHAIGERLGRARATRPEGDVVWLHAVSVGETRAVAPLIERLERDAPHASILLTVTTAAGREAARSLYGERVVQAWLPYDVPFAVRAFLDHFRPRAGLIVETELWPNLVHEASARSIPVFLVNARLSERSFRGYRRLAALAEPMLGALTGVAAQAQADAARLRELGARTVTVTGNLKFDMRVPEALVERGRALRERFGAKRPVWLAASTRDGEEALVLDALARAPLPPESLLLLVPRHPQRFDEVHELCARRGLVVARRSRDDAVTPATRIVLGDTMGEMLAYCAASDVAFVGGSLVPLGGQNLIEPIALGVPTLVGPHTFNFAEASAQAIEAGAARRVDDADALVRVVGTLLANDDARARMREAALAFHAAHRGAADRLWAWLAPQLGLARDAARTRRVSG